MLETVDWSANPAAGEFGRYGAVSVRYGKALKGGPPRRRTVLTTMGWAAEAVAEWVEDVRPLYGSAGRALWPTERRERVSPDALSDRFAAYRDELGLDANLGPHCLRHSYAVGAPVGPAGTGSGAAAEPVSAAPQRAGRSRDSGAAPR